MTIYKELFLDQGAYYSSNIVIKNSLTNENVNVSSYSVSGQIRRSYYSENASANVICTVADGPNGRVQIALTSNLTSNLKAGRYVYDIKAIVPPDNITIRLQEGNLTVSPQVTR